MRAILVLLGLLTAFQAGAQVQSREVSYADGDAKLTGYLYWDDAIQGKRPGVMVVHEWWGLNDYAKHRAQMLAQLGYVAFAADMYGDHKVTRHPADAQAWMEQVTKNTDTWQRRALAGLAVLEADPRVDRGHLAAVGYCFGGGTVMEMAYAGAPLDAVVSFHGPLPPATEAQQKHIHARILALHGDADAFEPPERIAAFKAALRAAGADWEMDIYGGTRHAFTNPDAGSYGMENLAYNPEADRRSWQRMQDFLKEAFSH
jgi:dienelactone hydrolase